MKEMSIDCNSFWLCHTKTATCTLNIIMKHAPIYNRHDLCFFACQLQNSKIIHLNKARTNRFQMFFIVIYDDSCFAM